MKYSEQMIDRDNFLSDPDNLHYEIHCFQCRNPLWRTRILKRSGDRVISTQTQKCDPTVPEFNRRIENCPICKKKFYTLSKQGGHMYLIRDMKSGIKRLV